MTELKNHDLQKIMESSILQLEPEKPLFTPPSSPKSAPTFTNALEYIRANYDKLDLVCLPMNGVKGKCPCIIWKDLTATPHEKFTPSIKRLGFKCGSVSNITVIDIDDTKHWDELNKILKIDLSRVPTVKTPSGGYHYYFQYNTNAKSSKPTSSAANIEALKVNGEKINVKIDVRSDGGFIVAPPTYYIADKPEKKKFDGKCYEWIVPFESRDQLQEIPSLFLELWSRQKKLLIKNETFEIIKVVDKNYKPSMLDDHEEVVDNTTNTDIDNEEDEISIMSSNKSISVETEKTPLTFDQVTKIVNGLNKARFKKYDDWCYLLWAIARWADEIQYDDMEVITMLDEYCSECEGYKDKQDVTMKYYEGQKPRNSEKGYHIGSPITWLKEDNIAVFNQVFPSKKELDAKKTNEQAVTNTFNVKDQFYWLDFEQLLRSKTFTDEEEMKQVIRANYHRVIARITQGIGCFIKKDSKKNPFTVIREFKKTIDIYISYYVKYERKPKNAESDRRIETVRFSDYILKNPIIQSYSDLDYIPDNTICPRSTFNIYKPIIAEKVNVEYDEKGQPKHAGLNFILWILRDLWANGNEEVYKWLLAWFKFLVTRLGEKTRTAIFLLGDQGSGKTCVIDFLSEFVLGEHLVSTFNGIEQYTDKHQTLALGKRLTYLNELGSTREEFTRSCTKLNQPISDKKITLNPKGKDMFEINDNNNFICSTNEDDSLGLHRSDRRMCCLQCSRVRAGPKHAVWWRGEIKKYFNKETGDMFYSYLADLETNVDPGTIPNTELREQMITQSYSTAMLFCKYWLDQSFDDEHMNKCESMPASQLYTKYREWCSNSGFKSASSITMFGMRAKKMLKFEKASNNIYYRQPAEL